MSMSNKNLVSLAICSGAAAALPAHAGQLSVRLQIPQIETAEYHRPYVAVWLEREDRSVAANLGVWYQQKRGEPAGGAKPGMPAGEAGTKWLPDLRQWWRRSGRELSLPVDGVSGATRPVGEHELSFAEGQPTLPALAAGRYKLIVEAAREDGGRELLDIPFDWPAKSAQTLKAQGKSELGALSLSLKP